MTRDDAPRPDVGEVADLDRLEAWAREGMYPNVSPCTVGCTFCYERHLHHFYPGLKVARIPPCTPAQLDHFLGRLRAQRQPAYPASPVSHEDGAVHYHSATDLSAQGFSREQLELLVAHNDSLGEAPYWNTTGKDLDLEAVRDLARRYPDSFRLRFSVLTFNDELKAGLIPRWTGSTDIIQAITLVREARIYLLHLDLEQTLADLDTLERCANPQDRPNVVIAPIHYNDRHAPLVKELARRGREDYRAMVEQIHRQRARWPSIENVYFHHPAEAYAWRFRNELRACLAPLRLGAGDLVLCSVAALEVLRDHVVPGSARVVSVRDVLGGSTTFATTLQTTDFVGALQAQGGAIRRAVVPSTSWWVDGGERSLDGETVHALRERFPGLEIVCVDIPEEVACARLTLEECLGYYGADLQQTARLRRDPAALQARARPAEAVTARGLIRRLSRGSDGEPLGPDDLDRLGEAKVTVSYDEVLVHRAGHVSRETVLTARIGPRGLARFRALFIDGCGDEADRQSALYHRFADYEGPT